MCDTCSCNITPGNEHLTREKSEQGVDAVTVLKEICVEKNLPGANDHLAQHNRAHFDEHRVLAIIPMSSPGAEKTALFEDTFEELKNEFRSAVIEGDLETENDAVRVKEERISFADARRQSPWTHCSERRLHS